MFYAPGFIGFIILVGWWCFSYLIWYFWSNFVFRFLYMISDICTVYLFYCWIFCEISWLGNSVCMTLMNIFIICFFYVVPLRWGIPYDISFSVGFLMMCVVHMRYGRIHYQLGYTIWHLFFLLAFLWCVLFTWGLEKSTIS